MDINDQKRLLSYYKEHYDRFYLSYYSVPHITEDPLRYDKLPNDRDQVENEGTAPPVKAGYKPKPETEAADQSQMTSQRPSRNQTPNNNNLDDLIDKKVEKKVGEYKKEFKKVISRESSVQKTKN